MNENIYKNYLNGNLENNIENYKSTYLKYILLTIILIIIVILVARSMYFVDSNDTTDLIILFVSCIYVFYVLYNFIF